MPSLLDFVRPRPAPRASSANPDELMGRAADQGLTLNVELRQMGMDAAGADLEVDADRLAALERQARSRADAQPAWRWGQDGLVFDARKTAAAEAAKARRMGMEASREARLDRIAAAEHTLAQSPDPGRAPGTPLLALAGTIALFATSIAPTLDFLLNPAGAAGLDHWALPFGIGIAAGLALSWPGLHAAREPEAPWFERHTFLVAGLVLAIGLATFRFRLADDAQAEGIAWAFIALEVAAVIIADGVALGHRRAWMRWLPEQRARAVRTGELAADRAALARVEADLVKVRTEEAAFDTLVHDRESSALARTALIEESMAVARDGFFQRLGDNRAALLRPAPPPPIFPSARRR